ncbi:MAG: beta strand repeat-containing protein, partial [Verrucomicrobiota bacterium]
TIGTGNTRIASDADLLTISGNITGSGSTSTLFQGNGNTLVSGNIGGAQGISTSFLRLVSSVLTLSGNNTFSGTLAHNHGILVLSGGSAIADSTGIQLNGANATLSVATSETIGSLIAGAGGNISIANGQTLTINQGSSQTFNGTISGSASLTKIGAAALTLTGNQTYSDGTTVNAGALNVTSTGSLASGSAFTLGASATANLSNSGQTLGAVSNSNTASNALNFSAASGSVTLASLSGAGNTRFGSNAVVNGGIGSGTVNAIGSLTANITGGTTTVGGVATIATMSGGTANLNGATSSIGTFNGGNIALGNSTTLSVSSGTSSGVISGGGSLNKTGAGALQLLGINSYTGGTTISEGTLAVNGSLAGNVTVNTEAILQGAGSIGGALSVSGQLAPGNSIESIGAASVSFLSGSTYAYEFESASLNGDLLYTLGELNITTGTLLSLTDLSSGVLAANSKLTLISYGSRSGGLFTYNGNTLTDGSKFTIGQNEWLFRYDDTVAGSNFSGDQTGATQYVTMTVIPEPSVAMMAGSLAMMALLRRRRD